MFNATAGNFQDVFVSIAIAIIALAFSISLHEAAHAWVAERLGDPTAKYLGRISLNPMVHIDLFGTIILPLLLIILQTGFLFGWAKPTPFNPWNLRNPKRDAALISLAGPASNFILAVAASLLFRFLPVNAFAQTILLQLIILNLVLAVFNLIPIPPLDGYKVVGGLLPRDLYFRWQELERYGIFLLFLIFLFGGYLLQPLLNLVLGFFLHFLLGAA